MMVMASRIKMLMTMIVMVMNTCDTKQVTSAVAVSMVSDALMSQQL